MPTPISWSISNFLCMLLLFQFILFLCLFPFLFPDNQTKNGKEDDADPYWPVSESYCAHEQQPFLSTPATMSKRGGNFSPHQNLILTNQSTIFTTCHASKNFHEHSESLLNRFPGLHFIMNQCMIHTGERPPWCIQHSSFSATNVNFQFQTNTQDFWNINIWISYRENLHLSRCCIYGFRVF